MHIALRAVLDLVPQHIHGLYRHGLFGLVDGGQVDPGEGGGADIIKADQAQTAGNVDPQLICRRLEGEFLNFRKTVPGDFPIQLKAQRADLIRCTDRVSLIIDDRTKNPLRCVFGENMLTITCATPLGRAEDCCPLEGDGGGMIVGFNNSYLMDALRYAPADKVKMQLNTGISPCIITPEDGGDSFLYMILPVRLRAEG